MNPNSIAFHTNVGLGRGEAELDQGNLGLLHTLGTASRVRKALVKHNALHELRVFDGAAQLLDNLDVLHVDVQVVRHTQNGVHNHRRDETAHKHKQSNINR
jgi:hypothetical protein